MIHENKIPVLVLFCLLSVLSSYAIKIDRVILATDSNPMYIEFWPLVAKAWQDLIGVKPTLALIADNTITVDESLGDVIRFEPIPGIPTAQQAQVIRLLLPAYFEDQVCIISDIDMLPISKSYFVDSIAHFPEDNFIIYRDSAYGAHSKLFSMCYNVAKGKVFKEIFNINSTKDIPKIIKQWNKLNYGWKTDEIILYQAVTKWQGYRTRCAKLGHIPIRRIDRSSWNYTYTDLKKGYYTDSHMLRPYSMYKTEIDKLALDLGLIKK